MPHADVADLHVNRLLTNLSVGYKPMGFIADDIFPMMGVNKQSDIIPFYDQSPWYRDEGENLVRAPGTEANKTGLSVDNTQTYFCVNNALGADIPYELADNQDDPYNYDRDVTMLITGLLMLRRDRKFAADHMLSTSWNSTTLGTKWSAYATSDPIQDMRKAQRDIRRRIGRRGNLWVFGDLTWQRLQDHPDFIGRLPDNTLRRVTRESIADILEIPRGNILVGESMFTTDHEGTAESSVTYNDVWDDDAVCLYRPDRPSLMDPASGVTFYWRNSVAPSAPQFVRRWDDTHKKKRVVEVHTYFHQRKLLTNSGEIFVDAVD